MTRTKKLILLAAGLVLAVVVAVLVLTPMGDPLRMAVGAPTTVAHDRVEQVAADPIFTDPRVVDSVEERAASTSLFFGRYPADGFVRVRNYPTAADPNADPRTACLEVQDDLVRAGWVLTQECMRMQSLRAPTRIDYEARAVRSFNSFCTVFHFTIFSGIEETPVLRATVPYDTNYAPGRYDDCQALLMEQPS